MDVILSFDVEEHYRIEAARGIRVSLHDRRKYRDRMNFTTSWLLDLLASRDTVATFFIVGQIARTNPKLVRAISQAGHEVASHGWNHRRIHSMTPRRFADDIKKSKDALEQATGDAVVGYRAPTFSIVRQTAWALDVLSDAGMVYDSSIYPVRHDRYGVPEAPRSPFIAQGEREKILEIPPATYRFGSTQAPMGGGGYFRLFPLWLTERALRQSELECRPAVAMLYFHPWEFDPDQMRLPLSRLSRLRTYVGLNGTRRKLTELLNRHRFRRAIDVARPLVAEAAPLPVFRVANFESNAGRALDQHTSCIVK